MVKLLWSTACSKQPKEQNLDRAALKEQKGQEKKVNVLGLHGQVLVAVGLQELQRE